MNIESRRESLQKSVSPETGGGPTLHFVHNMAAAPENESAQCTIVGYCRTFLFAFPRANLVESVECQSIYSDGNIRATIVSELPDYFERDPGDSRHYAVDVSLRAGVRRTYKEAFNRISNRTDSFFPLFLVVEENKALSPTTLDRGECVLMPEYKDGEEIIEGGREGMKALVAVKTTDGLWPDFNADMHFINIIVSAVKIEQRDTDEIRKLFNCCCFVSSDEQAVYPLIGKMNVRATSIANINAEEFKEKALRIAEILGRMTSERNSAALELFDAIVLDQVDDDNYLRLWYLRLWQAVEDAKRHLGHPQIWNSDRPISGKLTPKALTDYRNRIAHWHTGRMDFRYLADLQRTAMKLMRIRYGNSTFR